MSKTGAGSVEEVLIKLPEDVASAGDPPQRIELAPFDLRHRNRAVPMTWLYRESLRVSSLLAALREVLLGYPVLCGRYSADARAVDLCNAGLPVEVEVLSEEAGGKVFEEAFARMPISPEGDGCSCVKFFGGNDHERFVPTKAGMYPDTS
eukprot:Hpha_TRINITY_DN16994_c2_g8::TRINITY_DN16994_c2_g8_i1::g.54908::m.54908